MIQFVDLHKIRAVAKGRMEGRSLRPNENQPVVDQIRSLSWTEGLWGQTLFSMILKISSNEDARDLPIQR